MNPEGREIVLDQFQEIFRHSPGQTDRQTQNTKTSVSRASCRPGFEGEYDALQVC
jgi:hypothetical protein